MRVYVDSSAVIKRVILERESAVLVDRIDRCVASGDLLLSSTLAWIEVARALRIRLGRDHARVAAEVGAALSGIAEHPLGADVVSLARRLDPNALRSLDAIHLATAVLVDADVVLTYDERLAAACRDNGLTVDAPA